MDTSADQPQNPENTLGFTVNFSQCLASRGLTLTAGDEVLVGIQAWAIGGVSEHVNAQSGIAFEVQP